jgi:hypothetical protein
MITGSFLLEPWNSGRIKVKPFGFPQVAETETEVIAKW